MPLLKDFIPARVPLAASESLQEGFFGLLGNNSACKITYRIFQLQLGSILTYHSCKKNLLSGSYKVTELHFQ